MTSSTMNKYLTAHTELRIVKKILGDTFGYPTIRDCLEVLKTANNKVLNRHIESTNLKLEHELFMCEVRTIKERNYYENYSKFNRKRNQSGSL
jgi:hypothetical protein